MTVVVIAVPVAPVVPVDGCDEPVVPVDSCDEPVVPVDSCDEPVVPADVCDAPLGTKHKVNNSNQFIYFSVFIYRLLAE